MPLRPAGIRPTSDKLRDYYDGEAKERQTATLKKGKQKPVVETLPQREKSRDAAGAAVGVSGKLVDAARTVRKSYLRGKRYSAEKKSRGGKQEASAHRAHLRTSEKLAKQFDVDPATIRRDAKFAEAVDSIEKNVGKPLLRFWPTVSADGPNRMRRKPASERKRAASTPNTCPNHRHGAASLNNDLTPPRRMEQ